MIVIVSADDFGFDADTVDATIRGLTDGLIASASIMPTAPCAGQAAAWAGRHPDYDYGLHLSLAGDDAGALRSPADRIRTLLDREGRPLGVTEFRRRSLLGRIHREHVRVEVEAQLAFLADHGIRPSHVDGHHHVHKLPPVFSTLVEVLPRFGVDAVRTAQDLFPVSRNPLIQALNRRWSRRIARSFRTTDHFLMLGEDGADDWYRSLEPLLRGPGSLEFGYHPGRTEAWRARESALAVAVVALARECGCRLANWRSYRVLAPGP